MAQTIRIDFVGDITCPWSLIGLLALFNALEAARDDVTPALYLQPFEINPELGRDGANAIEHALTKFGAERKEIEAGRKQVKEQAARYNFTINQGPQTRIWNTRDAHRLMYWTGLEGKSLPLLLGFYTAYFTEERSLSDHNVLLDVVRRVGLNVDRARAVLSTNEYDSEVQAKEQAAAEHAVVRVPNVAFEQRWIVEGAQTPQIYGSMMRDILRGVLKPE